MTRIQRISETADLDRVFADSHRMPVWIFKHSLTCSISDQALRQFESFVAGSEYKDVSEFHLIEIQTSRPLSRAVAERTGVRHESPQALLIHRGETAWHASHWAITASTLQDAVEATASGSAPPATS